MKPAMNDRNDRPKRTRRLDRDPTEVTPKSSLSAVAATPPRHTALDAALDAVRALAIDTLHSTRTTRFHDAATLCALGQSLVRVFSQNVEDFDPNNSTACFPGALNVVGNYNGGVAMPRPYRAALQGHDQQDLRNVALGMDDTLRIQAETSRAQAAAAAAEELNNLLVVRAKVPDAAGATIQKRIDTLLEGMETRNALPPPAAPAPVFGPLAAANAPLPLVPAQRPR